MPLFQGTQSQKKFGGGSSPADWRARAAQLFATSDAAANVIERESLRRRAVAAENIADSMDLKLRATSAS